MEFDPIGHDMQVFPDTRIPLFFQIPDAAVDKETVIADLCQRFADLIECFRMIRIRKCDDQFGSGRVASQSVPYMFRCLRRHRFSALPAMELSHAGKNQFYIVGDFGHGTDGGAGGTNGIFSIDGNGRRDPFDAVDPGTVHSIHELPGIRRKCFHIPTLTLCIQRIKGQGRLPGAADAGDNGDFVQGNLQVNVFEIILPSA